MAKAGLARDFSPAEPAKDFGRNFHVQASHVLVLRQHFGFERMEARRQGRATVPDLFGTDQPQGGILREALRIVHVFVSRQTTVHRLSQQVTLRANEASILYNAACVYCGLNKKAEALDALRKAWEAGSKDAVWTRRDPDLALLRGDPEFERLYPKKSASPPTSVSH